jgi:hypothetical protein
VANTKSRKPIADADVPRIFDDARIDKLADIGRLPQDANRERFAQGVRKAAIIYARDARIPTYSELNAEIAALYRAAERKRCGEVAALLETLSPKARELLSKRATRLNLELPASEDLRDAMRQGKACEVILRLCQYGGCVKDRLRPSGKRSRTWRPLLVAKSPKSFPRRPAEQDFVIWLQLAWLEATGKRPSVAANPTRPGPFARMAAECLRLVGAGHADTVGLINELNRRRKKPPVNYQN